MCQLINRQSRESFHRRGCLADGRYYIDRRDERIKLTQLFLCDLALSGHADIRATTPEHAVSSLIWASTMGQPARVSELLELPKSADAARHYEFFTQQLSNVLSAREFMSVDAIKPNPDGTLRLNFAYRDLRPAKRTLFPSCCGFTNLAGKLLWKERYPKASDGRFKSLDENQPKPAPAFFANFREFRGEIFKPPTSLRVIDGNTQAA
jgi:hypothetical protein